MILEQSFYTYTGETNINDGCGSMQFQEWNFKNGCGHTFLLNKISNSKRPHKPSCPNCKEKKTLLRKSIHEIDLEKSKEIRFLNNKLFL